MDQQPTEQNATQTAILVALGVVVVTGIIGAALSAGSSTLIVGFGTMVAVQLLNLLQQARLAVTADKAAVKVAAVKESLDNANTNTTVKIAELAEVAKATHILVNSNMAVQLKLNAELSRWKAQQTGDAADKLAADKAEQMYHEHEAKQSQVDRQTNIPASQPTPPKEKGGTLIDIKDVTAIKISDSKEHGKEGGL